MTRSPLRVPRQPLGARPKTDPFEVSKHCTKQRFDLQNCRRRVLRYCPPDPDGKTQSMGHCARRDKDGDTQSISWQQEPGADKGVWKSTGGTGKYAAGRTQVGSKMCSRMERSAQYGGAAAATDQAPPAHRHPALSWTMPCPKPQGGNEKRPLVFSSNLIGELAIGKRLLLISLFGEFPKAGGFIIYGRNMGGISRRCGGYVAKMLPKHQAFPYRPCCSSPPTT